jgi:CubicO group peptidase (beta-lactamase class C family)
MSGKRRPSLFLAGWTLVAWIAGQALANGGMADSPRKMAMDIHELLSAAYPAGEPGAAVIVLRDGRPLIRQAYGMAHLELGVLMRPDMVFQIGSLTKQFTAVAILLLVQDGKLSLDDQITLFLPGYETYGRDVTVEHLLTHTSGIPNFTSLPGWFAQACLHRSVEDLIDIFREQPLEFPAGERFAYSNSGYVLLGAIIEKVAGESYAAFLSRRIFEPLGMSRTTYGSNGLLVPGRVQGYEKTPSGYRNAAYLSMSQPYAAGAVLSTVDDLARWYVALSTGRLLSTELLEKAFSPFVLNSGSPTNYGFGRSVGHFQGHRIVEHGGGIHGFLSHALHLPDDNIYVAILTNSQGRAEGPEYVASRIAALLVGRPWDPAPVELSPMLLDRYVGVYRINDAETRTVIRDGNRLFAQRTGGPPLELVALATDTFYYSNSFTRLRFEGNPTTRMVLTHKYGDQEHAVKIETEGEAHVSPPDARRP